MTELRELLGERILVLDGAMGTMVQGLALTEDGFRGKRFQRHDRPLQGLNDLLCLTRPKAIRDIHAAFLEAGADIVETNTFNAQAISLADYGLEALTRELNRAAARVARQAADAFTARDPKRPRFVAGSMGPTSRSASLSPDVEDPARRDVSFGDLAEAYTEQAIGLLEGGVDLLLPETAFDTLNLKAALYGIEEAFEATGRWVPVLASITITDRSGRTLSGQTVEAAWLSIAHADLLGVGLNCALGADLLAPHVEELSRVAPVYVHCYPNAGLPNELGGYDETPAHTARCVRRFAERGWLNLVGGCCGTTPAHIAAIAAAVQGLPPRTPPSPRPGARLAGLEPLLLAGRGLGSNAAADTDAGGRGAGFTVIGERTNVTGSRRFQRLIRAGDLEAAVEVARAQVEGGANAIDICMDEGLLDAEEAMVAFLRRIGAEPDVARVPVVLDSSRFEVLEAGLRATQGKCLVNSISLKEGEDVFRDHARRVRRYGAAVCVMAFDEQGQADSLPRRLEILSRAYRILVSEVGFSPEDIVFDPNVLAVGTGIEAHRGYAKGFIDAVRALKERFPRAAVSGGVSNVSFAFRGQNAVREAMHAVFLLHAIEAGLDMAIVNAEQLGSYEDIPAELRERVEDLICDRRPDATERLLEVAAASEGPKGSGRAPDAWRALPVAERLAHALIHGDTRHLDEDIALALPLYPSPLSVIEGPLMDGMRVVGDRFGAGKMFLPQVVKSARVMKRAVAVLEPLIDRGDREAARARRPRLVLATVKGDVHDIGKTIVSVVLSCNGYEVTDLGVMVPRERILAEAAAKGADAIGLSGLITPSLDEMARVAEAMEEAGLRLPLLIGGATTGPKHTAVRIAPRYSGPVVHVKDASRAASTCAGLLGGDAARRAAYVADVRGAQQRARERYQRTQRARTLVPLAEARARAWNLPHTDETAAPAPFVGARSLAAEDLDLRRIAQLIDWTPFFSVWQLKGVWPKILEDPRSGDQARRLHQDALSMIERLAAKGSVRAEAVYGFFPAARDGDDVVVFADPGRQAERLRLPMLRQQEARQAAAGQRGAAPFRSLADLLPPVEAGLDASIGALLVTAGLGVRERAARFEAEGDSYRAILVQAVTDRLAEALAERCHARIRQAWGHGEPEPWDSDRLRRGRYRGIRPAPGYPACPDHTLKRGLFSLLEADTTSAVRLTDQLAMEPAASVCALSFCHPGARYFSVGVIGRDQARDYARRRGVPLAEAERWLAPNLGYEPA